LGMIELPDEYGQDGDEDQETPNGGDPSSVS
jgi:hypothetical protein